MKMILKACVIALAAAFAMPMAAMDVQARPNEREMKKLAAAAKYLQDAQAAAEEKDFATAIEKMTEALALEVLPPETVVQVYANRGQLYTMLTPPDCVSAIADFNKVLELTPQAGYAHAAIGKCKSEMTPPDMKGAVAAFKQAFALEPTNASFAGALCVSAYNESDYPTAIEACVAYDAMQPGNVQILVAIATSYELSGDKANAAKAWARVLEADPTNKDAKEAPIRLKQKK